MTYGAKTARILELHAEGLWNAEIAKRASCSHVLVHNVLEERGLKRHRKRTDPDVARLKKLAGSARTLAGDFAEGDTAIRKEVALCLADAACEIERALGLLTADEADAA